MAGQLAAMQNAMMVFNAVMALAFAALFAWIIRRLVAPEIRQEFAAAP